MKSKPDPETVFQSGQWQVRGDGELYHPALHVLISPEHLSQPTTLYELESSGIMKGQWETFMPAYLRGLQISNRKPVRLTVE